MNEKTGEIDLQKIEETKKFLSTIKGIEMVENSLKEIEIKLLKEKTKEAEIRNSKSSPNQQKTYIIQ